MNTTRNTVVVASLEVADNPWTRFKGLMCRPSIPEGHGLWLSPCSDIHSCFMRFEFDAIFLNAENEVVYLIKRMKPWRISPLNLMFKGANVVLEVNGGVIDQTTTQIGDTLQLA